MAAIDLTTAHTTQPDAESAADELAAQLEGVRPKLLTLFAERGRDQRALNAAIRERFPGVRLVGATTGGEIDRRGFHQGSVVLGALRGDFEVGLGLGRGLSNDAIGAGSAAMRAACAELGTTPERLDVAKHVGVVIDDGFRWKKEELLLGMLEANPDVLLVGGGASDREYDVARASAEIHVDGEVETDATLLALIRTDAPFAALRNHWYLPTGKTLRITKVDESARRALEIDGQPAAQRYAELLGVSVDDLEFGKPLGFAQMPTALKVGREYFLRAPWKPLPDGSVLFANLLDEGVDLELMQLGDVTELTRRFWKEEVPARVKNPRAALVFHCGARYVFSAVCGKQEELGATFADAPTCAGYNVFFETFRGFHINTTLTTLVFGASDPAPGAT
jgi:hypothetical protein